MGIFAGKRTYLHEQLWLSKVVNSMFTIKPRSIQMKDEVVDACVESPLLYHSRKKEPGH